ncbi:cytochrome b N-terminal domain-containing protein [Castellaniella sp.]|uniref:cytochrome b N-terminal domain-containing protein n=1 Tax=Castellaniella sp. TaxID=1955812 RepID=UPI002D7F52EB|nr:cytochrome b N-terminal domain-containing protein [Castellaniella sp.]HET8703043.1 cytochrome b N-terminal domain-containing protein [Castellaniella sp.]
MIKRIQAVLQWLFLSVEGLFNAAFGDRVNPFYHLGAITFFLFWLVGGSGLYLYVFFDTGIPDAYDSVYALSTKQWWLGGILRSVHRYASDAMVLTMALHMLRYFAFDRFRGFRWFSWLTGVMLIWMVYATGINGYMLPWDQLAQYATVTAFEWLDWLPIFDGALMRNFLYAKHVGNRFFTLLSFMHVGLPLVVLMVMSIHAQRVPKARTMPPRPIAGGLSATLLALAIVAPVHSQGGVSDLARAVTSVELDWFYMAVFPLMTQWPMGWVWALVVGGSVLLALMPWFPPRFRRGERRPAQLVVHGEGGASVQFQARQGETILDAGLREGLGLSYECRNGACGLCICTVRQGAYDHRPCSPGALAEDQKAGGMALMCCAVPRGDMEVEVRGFTGGGALAVREYTASVVRLEPLSADVMLLVLRPSDGAVLDFKAGQYINILLEDGQRRAFSFANPPRGDALIELHVRLVPGGRFTTRVFRDMKVGDAVRFEGPLGRFTLRDSPLPILFVAGATGFAPVKSILEDAFARGVSRPMRLYWGVRRREDLYMLELCERWQREHASFNIVPVLSDPAGDDGWTGRTGLVHEAILADFADLHGYEVYLCGSVRMVEAAAPAFIGRGLDEQACFSDAFLPAARLPANPGP